MHLLDTCVVSEARRGTTQAVIWLQCSQSDTLYMSVITIGEIMKDVMIKMRTDPQAAVPLLRWLDELRFVYRERILPIDDAVATG